MLIQTLSVVWTFMLGYLATQTKAYPSAGWPIYAPALRDYPEDDYYYSPKVQPSYYSHVQRHNTPEVYGRIPYPYYYDQYAFVDEDPERQDERLAALPVGQETWYETETEPSWRAGDLDDVKAAFLDNLILTQMAEEAQRRREYARNTQTRPQHLKEYEEPREHAPRDLEDEDVRELKALAGKPVYHVPKTAPVYEYDDYSAADDAFINWNGNKRSVSTAAPPASTSRPREGQDEVMLPRPATNHHTPKNKDTVYEKITQLLATESRTAHNQKDASKFRRLDKRFVSGESDLVAELRGLKHRIRT